MKGLFANMWDNKESVVGGIFDIFSKKNESKLGDDVKYGLLARNFIPDMKEGADELKTIIDNPRLALKSALELGGGAIGKITPDYIKQGLLKVSPDNLITSERTSAMASDAYEDIKTNLGSIDAVKKTIQDNPFDTLLAASGIGAVANQVRKVSTPTIKKALAQAEANGLMDEIRKVGSTPVGLSMKDVSDPMIVQHNMNTEALQKHLGASGIPMPSIAISKVDNPIKGFGEISLLGSTDLVKPSATTKVYPVDMYSGRAPHDQLKYTNLDEALKNIDSNVLRFHANVKPIPDATAMSPQNSKFNKGQLQEGQVNGILKQKATGSLEKQMLMINQAIEMGFDPYKYPTYRQAMYEIDNELIAQGKPRMTPLSSDNIPREGLLANTQRTMTNPSGEFTALGNRRPEVEYSAENALKVMRRRQGNKTGAEGYQSVNQTIALASTPFKNLDEIKKSRGLLEDSQGLSVGDSREMFELELMNVQEKLSSLGNADAKRLAYVMEDRRDALIDDVLRDGKLSVEDVIQMRYTPDQAKKAEELILSLKIPNNPKIPTDPIEALRMKNLPLATEYFEAKPNKIIDIAEFKGAIIPKDTKPTIIKLLKDKGIKKILSYGTEAERKALFNKFPELHFIGLAMPTSGLLMNQGEEARQGLLL